MLRKLVVSSFHKSHKFLQHSSHPSPVDEGGLFVYLILGGEHYIQSGSPETSKTGFSPQLATS